MANDLFSDDLRKISNDDLFKAVAEFAIAQPIEGWRHDYTEIWDDSALKCIAGFANTFGGLLIVGVRKQKQDIACELVGVNSKGEYKTRIASAIAANITPTPFYEIFECFKPGSANIRFCIVRVQSRKSLHLITKKEMQPVYVRNEDEARPADAAQLRGLIDREKEAPTYPQKLLARACQLRDTMLVNYEYQNKDSSDWFLSPRRVSASFLKLELIPSERFSFEMDRTHEQWLRTLINKAYPRVSDCVARKVAQRAESRDADYYEYVWYHRNLDYEGRWRITSGGEFAYATQMRYPQVGEKYVWSVVDLAIHSILFISASARWWEAIRFYGDGRLYAQLNVDGVELLQSPDSGAYTHAVNPAYKIDIGQNLLALARDVIVRSVSARSSAAAEVGLNYFSVTAELSAVAGSLLNSLVRSLGHAVVLKRLEEIVQDLAAHLN
jgi:hypothetical protein